MDTAEIAAKRSGETLRKWVENDRKGANSGKSKANQDKNAIRKHASIFSASMSNAAYFFDQMPNDDNDKNEEEDQNEKDEGNLQENKNEENDFRFTVSASETSLLNMIEQQKKSSVTRDRLDDGTIPLGTLKSAIRTASGIERALKIQINNNNKTNDENDEIQETSFNNNSIGSARQKISFRNQSSTATEPPTVNVGTEQKETNSVSKQQKRASSNSPIRRNSSRFSSYSSFGSAATVTSSATSAQQQKNEIVSTTHQNRQMYSTSSAVTFIHNDQRMDEVALRILFKEHCDRKTQTISVASLDTMCAHIGLTGGHLIELAARKTGFVGKRIAEIQKRGLPVFSDVVRRRLSALTGSSGGNHSNYDINGSDSGEWSQMEQLQGLTVVDGSLNYEEFCLVMSLIPQ
jgi:hypothetical protein